MPRSTLAATLPALEAAGVAPSTAVRAGSWETGPLLRHRVLGRTALGAFIAAAGTAQLPPLFQRPIFGYLSALLVIAGFSLAAPLFIEAIAFIARRMTPAALDPAVTLAPQNLRARVRRNAIAVASLMVGVAMTVSVTTMIASFRASVVTWVDRTLRGDIYVRPQGAVNAEDVTMSGAPATGLEHARGIAAVDIVRAKLVPYRGRLTYVAASDMRVTGKYGELPMLSGGSWPAVARRLADSDSVAVSEPFARKFGVRSGDWITLDTAAGSKRMRVLGVYEDYSSDLGYAFMDLRRFRRLYEDDRVNGFAVYVKPGTDLAAARAAVRAAFLGRYVTVQTNRDLRAAALGQFDRTFAVTHSLDAMAITIALMGIIA